eukprot:CAMPEP_0113973068 /NCGR_PEP_ID=MMETSP0011_2-20120614/14032_1 /TAXON_ID=101924 /ORGANISM="Rhodosorus marinus" /LENGTH=307 /DNA_ID=CAMNT_0000990525 /DNA_START=629 /DNA_END=1552 /DNA_ORIENTATION=+ /assembly_acc=CAM_ASM_000156
MEKIEEFEDALNQIKSFAKDSTENLDGYIERVAEGQVKLSGGMSLLAVKSHTFLSYLLGMVIVAAMKVGGRSIENHPVIDMLVENRVILEKLKPLEEAQRYQIDKMIKLAMGNHEEEDEEAIHAPNLSSLVEGANAKGEEEGEEDGEAKVYKPPRLVAVPFDNVVDKDAEREKRRDEREKDRARRSSAVRELLQEFGDRPEHIRENAEVGNAARELDRMDEAKKKYEEDYFVRLNTSKEEKRKRRDLKRKARMEELGGGDLRDLVSMTERINEQSRKREKERQLRDSLASQQMIAKKRRKSSKSKRR